MKELDPFPTPTAIRSGYPWRLFFLLLAACVVAVAAVLPYLSVVIGPTLAKHRFPLPLPALALVQATINFGLAAGLGLFFAHRVGMGAPILESWVYGRPVAVPRGTILVACGTGLALGAITLALIHSSLGASLRAMPVVTERAMPAWKRFLACFYGGVCEEVLTRLFLLSTVVWLFLWLARARSVSRSLFWIANVLVALAFGAGHLPLTGQIAPLTPQLVVTVISLNALVSLPFGYLYRTRGLEAAMLAHFSTDFILHVAGPLLT